MKLPRSCVTMCDRSSSRSRWVTSTSPDRISIRPRPGLADPRDHLAGTEAARLAEPGKPGKLVIRQAREHLRPARRDQVALAVAHSAGTGSAEAAFGAGAFTGNSCREEMAMRFQALMSTPASVSQPISSVVK